MRGTYRFYQNGVLIGEKENIITTAGRALFLRYLAGQSGTFAGSIAVGSGTKAAAVGDARLTMEFDRATLSLSSLDVVTNRVVYKTTLTEGLVGSIYEVGLYSSPYGTTGNGFPSRLLFVFDTSVEAWSTGTAQTANARIGGTSLRLAPAASATASTVLTSTSLDLSGYDNIDQLSLAFFVTGTVVPASVALRFRGADPAGYYETVASTGLVAGYNVVSVDKSAFTKTGVVDWSGIDSVEVRATSGTTAATIDLDAIRVEDMSVDSPDHVLVSRTVLAAPTLKTSTAPLDIEYMLETSIV